MSEDEFHIYLPSNVSTDIFTDNSPAKFSTILAEDVHLQNGNWEVAVKNIIYPCHVASTTKEDKIYIYKYKESYRNLYPLPSRENYQDTAHNVYGYQIPFPTLKEVELLKSKKYLAQTLVNNINQDLKLRKFDKLVQFKLEPRGKSFAFGFEVFPDDFIAYLDPKLRRYLGFKYDRIQMKGTLMALNSFDPEKEPPVRGDQIVYFGDLRSQEQAKCQFVRSIIEKGDTSKEIIYTAEVELRFRQNRDDDLLSVPKMIISVRPELGIIRFTRSNQDIPASIAAFEKKIRLIRFDDTIKAALNLKPLYFSPKLLNDATVFRFSKKKSSELMKITSFFCTVYFEGMRRLENDLTDDPIDTVQVDVKESFKKPTGFEKFLNTAIVKKQ